MLKLFQEQKDALGSTIILSLVASSEPTAVFTELWVYILQFEKRFSRFLPNSELTNFNRNAGLKTPVTSEFKALLLASKQMAKLSGGLFNPFILPALQRAGYRYSLATGHQSDPQEDYTKRSVVSANKLRIGNAWAEIPYGTALDFGGCGKGYVGDRLVELITSHPAICGYWFSIGGDVVCGGTNEQQAPWTVHVQDAFTPQLACKNHITTDGTAQYAVATSSTSARRGKGWHHILDPSTGKPANTDVVSASVCSNSLLEADVFASCALLCGSKQATAFLQSRGITDYLLQCTTKNKPAVIASKRFTAHRGDW